MHNRLFGLIAVVMTLALLLQSCTQKPERNLSDYNPNLELAIDHGHLYALSPSLVRRYQPHLRMAATWDNGVVRLEVMNRRLEPMVVGPQHFALVKGVLDNAQPREVIPITPENARVLFPTTTLKHKEIASGTIQFSESFGDLTGEFLAFKHPDEDILPSRCRISPKPTAWAPDSAAEDVE